MAHACIGFDMERAEDALAHFVPEVVEEYGSECEGKTLHTWDDGQRTLLRCKACGGYVLLQRSEYHGLEDDDRYKDYFPVGGPEDAAEMNRKFDGYAIESDFPGRYLRQDNASAPNWSQGRQADSNRLD